ncbi:MAG: (2Fe-2S)-binding protein [Thermodesulfobacteriota bacterium]
MNIDDKASKSKKQITLTVNGAMFTRDVFPHMTLAEFLREELKLTGTKVGCNRGECGSCTVILDGHSVYACTMLAVEAGGKSVQTIESLSVGDKLHPIQQAFIDQDALQCGYCSPGMIMSVKNLLDRTVKPTEDDVRCAIDGNFCRCGSYQNIIKAAIDASDKTADPDRS